MEKDTRIGIIVIIVAIFSISIFLSTYLSTNDDNFEKIRKEFQSGDIRTHSNIVNIPKEYYLRPEFYTTYDAYKNVTEQKGTYGYGAQPSEIYYDVTKFEAGQYIDVYTFIISSYDVGNYQGIGLNLVHLNDELFETYVDPSDILLHPILLGSPKNQSDWAYRIHMTIVAKKDIPKGTYTFKLLVRQPSLEKEEEFYNVTQDLKGNYVNIGPIRPSEFFGVTLNVD